MDNCLIGYTGFVGSNLLAKDQYKYLYNSKNFRELADQTFDRMVCCGISAVKWLANKEPVEDWRRINQLIEVLKTVRATKGWVVSTIDVYENPVQVTEATPLNEEKMMPYGRHRYRFEKFIKESFENVYIVRLPGLFGPGLKKNVIYDFINDNQVHKIHSDETHQFYNIELLHQHFMTMELEGLNCVNFSSEPVTVRDLAAGVFGVEFNNKPDKIPCYYDMQSNYAEVFGSNGKYLFSKQEVLSQIKTFVSRGATR